MSRDGVLPLDCFGLICEFLSIIDPSLLNLLPVRIAPSYTTPPLDDWHVLHRMKSPGKGGVISLTVREYRAAEGKNFYAVASNIADLSAASLWAVMVQADHRQRWDQTCEHSENLEHVSIEGLDCTIDYLRLDGIFPVVKPRDLCMLTVKAQLPPLASGRQRFISASTSTSHRLAPVKKSHFRFEPSISGLIVTEDGNGGVDLLQVADLGALAAWVPSYIAKLCCQTLLPRNVQAIAEAARKLGHDTHGHFNVPPILVRQPKNPSQLSEKPQLVAALQSSDQEKIPETSSIPLAVESQPTAPIFTPDPVQVFEVPYTVPLPAAQLLPEAEDIAEKHSPLPNTFTEISLSDPNIPITDPPTQATETESDSKQPESKLAALPPLDTTFTKVAREPTSSPPPVPQKSPNTIASPFTSLRLPRPSHLRTLTFAESAAFKDACRLSYAVHIPSANGSNSRDDEADDKQLESLQQLLSTDEGMNAARRVSALIALVEAEQDASDDSGGDTPSLDDFPLPPKFKLNEELAEAARPFTVFLPPPTVGESNDRSVITTPSNYLAAAGIMMTVSSAISVALYAPLYALGYGGKRIGQSLFWWTGLTN